MEQNPEKKEKLTSSNNVLKLAADLLKVCLNRNKFLSTKMLRFSLSTQEIEVPFKISGFNVNPYLSAAIRVLIVSALSGICSDILGFKLKLFKFKE